MTQWKCFVRTHLLFVTAYGLMWSSLVTFKHNMTLVQAIRGFPKVDHSGRSARIVLEQINSAKKPSSNRS